MKSWGGLLALALVAIPAVPAPATTAARLAPARADFVARVRTAPVVLLKKAPVAPIVAPQGMRDIVWQRAQQARRCAVRAGKIAPTANLAVIDYDMPSTSRRLWIVDPTTHKTLLSDFVAHGRGSGELTAHSFSNQDGSFQTSLGVFRVSESYQGKHGISMRLDGLEQGFNDHARARAIVMHSAWYVEPAVAAKTGRLGRSQGCPAVREEILGEVEQDLGGGGMLFAYASQQDWLQGSAYLNCT